MTSHEYIGFISYSGSMVEKGIFDARDAAKALVGFDSAVRHFVCQQAPELSGIDFEMPVRIRKGSWIIELLVVASGIIGTTYAATAAKKLAENDFSDVGLKDLFSRALRSVQYFATIGKHVGSVIKRNFDKMPIKDEGDVVMIGIPGRDGQILYIPKEYWDMYLSAPARTLEKIAELVEKDRELTIGVEDKGRMVEESIQVEDRPIFIPSESETEDELLFPELRHGEEAVLEGNVTRGNEEANTLGFKYNGHIITCEPKSGSVVAYKPSIFRYARIYGRVDRSDTTGGTRATRPRIVFDRVEPIDGKPEDVELGQKELF